VQRDLNCVTLKKSHKEKLQHLQHACSHVPLFRHHQAESAAPVLVQSQHPTGFVPIGLLLVSITPHICCGSAQDHSILIVRCPLFLALFLLWEIFLTDPALQTHLQTPSFSFCKSSPLSLFSSRHHLHFISVWFLFVCLFAWLFDGEIDSFHCSPEEN